MPNWNSVLKEIASTQTNQSESAFDKVRRKYLRALEKHTGRNVISYYSGFLSKKIDGIEITDEDKNGFMLCIHELNRERGLDLILHTPGGDGKATESLVDYLRSMFNKNIRAIIPQMAMSAGTMIACSCKEIIMGKHSSLGPIDPQYGAVAAVNLMTEVKKAFAEITSDQTGRAALFWNPILNQIPPGFLTKCEEALNDSNAFIEKTLTENMLSSPNLKNKNERLKKAKAKLTNQLDGKAHNTHFEKQECLEAGLEIISLEDDSKLQDLVLTIHHCYMHTLAHTGAFKIIENGKGKAMIKVMQPQFIFAPPSLTPPTQDINQNQV